MKQLENFTFKSYDYIKQFLSKDKKFIDYENTQMNKYSGYSVRELINNGLDNTSDAIYNILFEINYIPKYIMEILLVGDVYNAIMYCSEFIGFEEKDYSKMQKIYSYSLFLDKLRFEELNNKIQKIIPRKDKDTYLKIESHAMDLKKFCDDFIDINYKYFNEHKLKYLYGPNGLYYKRLINKAKHYVSYKYDYYFNDRNKTKKFMFENLKDCEKIYGETKKHIKEAIEKINSDKIKEFIGNIDSMYLHENTPESKEALTMINSINELVNYCEESAIRLIATHNIMKSDKYRKFR